MRACTMSTPMPSTSFERVHARRRVGGDSGDERLQLPERAAGLIEPAARGKRQGACVQVAAGEAGQIRVGRGEGEDLVP